VHSVFTTFEISTLNQFHFPSPKPSGTRRQLAKPARIDCEAAVALFGDFIQSGEEFAALGQFYAKYMGSITYEAVNQGQECTIKLTFPPHDKPDPSVKNLVCEVEAKFLDLLDETNALATLKAEHPEVFAFIGGIIASSLNNCRVKDTNNGQDQGKYDQGNAKGGENGEGFGVGKNPQVCVGKNKKRCTKEKNTCEWKDDACVDISVSSSLKEQADEAAQGTTEIQPKSSAAVADRQGAVITYTAAMVAGFVAVMWYGN